MEKLPYQIDSLDGVNEALQSFYSEAETGGYVLKVEGVVPKSQFDQVNQRAVDAAEEARRRRATVERVTGKLGIEDASKLDEALDAILSKSKAPGKDDKDQQAIVDQIREQYEGRLTETQKQLEAIRIQGVRSQLVSALMAEGFGEKAAAMIAQGTAGRIQFDGAGEMRIMQENGNPLAGTGAGGLATLSDLTATLAADFSDLLADKGKSGGGKPPASAGTATSGNPLASIPGFSQLPVS